MIKVCGKQVTPSEIEDLIMTNESVNDCAVIGIPDDKYGEVVHAFVVRSNSSLTKDKVINFVNGKVSEYCKITGGVSFVDKIPRNKNGKILRKELKELYNNCSK